MPPWLLAALARLDDHLRAACVGEEARVTSLMGAGLPGWEGVRALLDLPAGRLAHPEATPHPPLVPDGDHELGHLAAALGLESIASDMVLVLLAPHVEPRYRTVLGVLADVAAPTWVSERALVTALGRSPASWLAVRRALSPAGPLVAGGFLLSPGVEGPLARSWDLAPEVAAVLIGVPAEAAVPGARWMPTGGEATPGRSVHVVSADADWAELLLERHADDATGVLAVTLPRVAPVEALRAAWRVSVIAGAVLAVDVDAVRGEDLPEAVDTATFLARQLGGRVVVVTRQHAVRSLPMLTARAPTFVSRVAAWRAAVEDRGGALGDGAAERLAAAWRVPRGTIAGIVGAADGLDEESLATAAARQLRADVPHGVERVARHTLDDLVLRDTTRDGLRRLLYFVRNRDRLGDDPRRERAWRLGHGPVVLFSGRSGTGKTLAAEAVADALHRPLVVVDLSRLVSKYIGETEKHVDEVLGAAQRAGCVLFFDEADALFAQRTDVASSNDRYANLEVGYLLQRIEQHDGVVILATNLRQSLDEAFLRRFQFRIEFPLPDARERAELWRRLLAVAGDVDPRLDLDGLAATHRLSGGDIRNASLKGLLLAEAAGVPLTQVHLEEAVALELLEMGRLSRRPDGPSDRGQLLARVVDALDVALREWFERLFRKEIHLVHGAPTRETLAGKRPAVALSVYRVAGPRAGKGFRFGAILSAWSNRPEEEHELLGVLHEALAATPTVVVSGGQATLRLQESADFDLLHRFWSSHGQPVRASVVVEGEAST